MLGRRTAGRLYLPAYFVPLGIFRFALYTPLADEEPEIGSRPATASNGGAQTAKEEEAARLCARTVVQGGRHPENHLFLSAANDFIEPY